MQRWRCDSCPLAFLHGVCVRFFLLTPALLKLEKCEMNPCSRLENEATWLAVLECDLNSQLSQPRLCTPSPPSQLTFWRSRCSLPR